ncbi:hypothetical protein [Streptomyces sp. NPDC047028]|uniref:hypothetical protein n=1 Tax=Streptomyces sp. NPDC047028 TaxID=3155793 RepID=UPI0033CBFA93
MPIVRVRFRSAAPARPAPEKSRVCSPLLHDLLWAHALPADGIDHITVRPFTAGRTATEAAVFVRAESDARALGIVRALLDRVRPHCEAHGLTPDVPTD